MIETFDSVERDTNPVGIPDFGDTSRDDWKTNRRGIEALDPDFVLPPFEDVRANHDGAEVWFRHYRLAESGLLEQVRIGGADFLARPMNLELKVNGEQVLLNSKGSELVSSHRGRAVFKRTMSSADIDVTTLVAIEYDGMVRIDMTLSPKKTLSLDGFSYGFSLPREHAEFIHFVGCPPENNISIMIPGESYTMSVPGQPGTFFSEAFKTLVWLGDKQKGFLWFCGSEQHWSPQKQGDRPDALTASVNGREVEFKVAPVSASYEISAPITYTFGFFATPVRPMPEGWRSWLFTTRQAAYESEFAHGDIGNMAMIWPDEYRAIGALPRIQPKDEPRIKGYVKELKSVQGRHALTYCDPIRVGIGYLKYLDSQSDSTRLNDLFLAENSEGEDAFKYRVPEVAENMKEWQTRPEMIYSYGAAHGGREVRVSSASGWTDFFCFLMEKLALMGFDGMGDIDNCFPIRDMNEAHGAGYVDQDGVRRHEWDWFARRDLMKRVAATFLKVRGKPAILVAHASATWSIPFISFCDAMMSYEHSNSGYFSRPGFLSKYCSCNSEITADIKNEGHNFRRRVFPTASRMTRSPLQAGRDFLRRAFPRERWLGELSGHQFGLPVVIMSNLTKSPQVDKEYAKSEKAARELLAFAASHDCIYWPIWCNTKPIIDYVKIRERFGIGDGTVEFFPYWGDDSPIRGDNPGIHVTTYRNGDSYLAVVANLGESAAETVLAFPGLTATFAVEDAETGQVLALADKTLAIGIEPVDYRILTINHSDGRDGINQGEKQPRATARRQR